MPLYTLQNISYVVDRKPLLDTINLIISPEQRWVILGPNGSGKTLLAQIFSQQIKPTSGFLSATGTARLVSFEKVTEIMDQIRYHDSSNSSGGYDQGITVQQYLFGTKENNLKEDRSLDAFDLCKLMDRGVKFLSTGEMRKVVIGKALLDNPTLLILDEPFDGLDRDSCLSLESLIKNIADQGITVLLFLNRFDEVPKETSHLAFMNAGNLLLQGDKNKILPQIQQHPQIDTKDNLSDLMVQQKEERAPDLHNTLIAMKNVSVSYQGKTILDRINWTVSKNEHWMITGPNGCGKTTLLHLITGDNPQGYANDISLFGQKKGTGESLWDIKKRIGYISTSLHREYRVGGTVLSVVLSGLFDSIGVYNRYSQQQKDDALSWLKLIGLAGKKTSSFRQLSFGQQRLVLIARAMIKQPDLLILDEPCQGLDENSRQLVLEVADKIGLTGQTHILYVTHHPEDTIPCMTHHLEFFQHSSDNYSITTKNL